MTQLQPEPLGARAQILARIAAAAAGVGRDPASVTLTAVCKGQPWDKISSLLAAGQDVWGENRLQEARSRWDAARAGQQLRLIGALQTNKAAAAATFFDLIETLDRPRLAEALARQVQRLGRPIEVYVQVNTGEEPQKAGVWPREAGAFIEICRRDFEIWPRGLMCVPPAGEPAAPHFALLAKIAAAHGLADLSMGMSSDYEIAVRLGATHVRIGSALFGARPAHA